MNVLSRRSIVRSGSVLLALPFAGPLLPAYGAEQANSQTAPPTGAVKLSSNASTAVSLDFVNFVKDQSAKVTAANHQGKNPDYASLGDQFHMLGKHMSLAGADKLVKKHWQKPAEDRSCADGRQPGSRSRRLLCADLRSILFTEGSAGQQ